MRTAHLILAHKSPEQTERLIKKMLHPDFDFYIHLDKKVDMASHSLLANLPNVFFIKDRVDIKWAGYSIVKATFNGIREICATKRDYNFINFISGQDYPLKSASELADFFEKNIGKEFLSYVDFEKEWQEGLLRYQKYYLSDYTFKGRYLLEKTINYLTPTRKLPYNYHAYGKSMFWMLSPEAALYVADKVERDPKLRRFFSLSWASDEFVFQTILMNSPFRARIVNENYRYIDWSQGGPHPKLLRTEDFENMKNSGMLFGRKFDLSKDAQIFDLIDANT